MALQIKKLSALGIARLSQRGYYCDGAGLWLQVSVSKTKSWIFRFHLGGKRREMGLGSIHTIDLATARILARECREMVLQGKDPIAERNAGKHAERLRHARLISFDQCSKAYIAAHRRSWKSVKHARQWDATLRTYASPTIGELPVADVDTGEGYSLAVVNAPDMFPICTTYAGEVAPARSKRETVSLRALPRFMEAIRKSYIAGWYQAKAKYADSTETR